MTALIKKFKLRLNSYLQGRQRKRAIAEIRRGMSFFGYDVSTFSDEELEEALHRIQNIPQPLDGCKLL